MTLQSLIDKVTLQLKDPKRRLQYFLLSLVFIYFIWAFLFLNPVRSAKNDLERKSVILQNQMTDISKRISTLNDTVNNKDISKALAKKKQLEIKINQLDQDIAKSHLLFITGDEWIQLKKGIVEQQQNIDKSITLVTILDHPIQRWVPPATDKTDPTKLAPEAIYQHQLELRFQADYFSTIEYLSRLEKLPWQVYWDSLNYTVLTYPKAEVLVKFHIFTHEKSET